MFVLAALLLAIEAGGVGDFRHIDQMLRIGGGEARHRFADRRHLVHAFGALRGGCVACRKQRETVAHTGVPGRDALPRRFAQRRMAEMTGVFVGGQNRVCGQRQGRPANGCA